MICLASSLHQFTLVRKPPVVCAVEDCEEKNADMKVDGPPWYDRISAETRVKTNKQKQTRSVVVFIPVLHFSGSTSLDTAIKQSSISHNRNMF